MGVFVIAEIGSVHDGSFGNAKRLVDAAAERGVNAVKLQTHIAEAETVRGAPPPSYFTAEPRYEYFERTAFSEEQWRGLAAHSAGCGVELLSSPFSVAAVELLERVGIGRYKIPSGEVTNLPLLEAVAATGKPALLSSGMSSWDELDRAVALFRPELLTLLQCTSEYPCPYDQVGLNVLAEMRERYGLPVGLSDHTLTNYTSFAAVALGASVVEKHFTFSRLMYGSDARHSLEPVELGDLVAGIRAIETALASPVDKGDASRFAEMKATFEKSVVAATDIEAGTTLAAAHLTVKRPGTGLPSACLPEIVGRRVARAIPRDTLLDWADLA